MATSFFKKGVPTVKANQTSPGCAMVFFSVFFLGGSLLLIMMVRKIVLPEWHSNHYFVEHSCEILDKRITESPRGGTYRPEILIRYEVNGREYRTWTYDTSGVYSSGRTDKEEILNRFAVGERYPCWYDPENPSRAVLVQGYSWVLYLFLLIPLAFITVGAGGMYYFLPRLGKSPERQAAMEPGPKTDQVPDGISTDDYPNVPDIDLHPCFAMEPKYRLRPGISPGCSLVGLIAVALFWNCIVSVFVGAAIGGHLQGEAFAWYMTVFLIPFVAIGFGLVFYVFKQLLVILGTRRTIVAISAHPLYTGQDCEILVVQSGRLRLNDLRVLVVCDEIAERRWGSNRRTTETRHVHEVELFRRQDFEIGPASPCEIRSHLQVPEGAMHSFTAGNNQVCWKICVKGDVAWWPNFAWEFPFTVRPRSPQRNHT